MTRLTELAVKAAKTITKERLIADGQGLYLRVRPGSAPKVWFYRYCIDGRSRKLQLGTYPQLSLAAARKKACELSQEYHSGQDPAELRALRKEESERQARILASKVSVLELFDRWNTIDLSRHKDGGHFVRRAFKKDVLPAIGQFLVQDVTKADLARICDGILARGSNRMAKMILSLLRQFFRFGVDRGVIEVDPSAGIQKSRIGGKDTIRDRILSDEEICLLFRRLPESGLPEPIQIAIWISLATCCRIGEIAQAKWTDFDLRRQIWRIPAENSKNGREHLVNLSEFAVEKINRLWSLQRLSDRPSVSEIKPNRVWLYPARQTDGSITGKALSKLIMDRQRQIPMSKRAGVSVCSKLVLPLGRWTPHDLRRTGCTIMLRCGVLPAVCERVLNHQEENRLRAVYQRYEYAPEMKSAWNKLGEHLSGLEQSAREGQRHAA